MAWNDTHGGHWGNNETDNGGYGDGDPWRHSGGDGLTLTTLRSWQPYTSYAVATCWLTFLCVIAVGICMKSMTRLRGWACYITFLGLSIAILGLLRAKLLVSPNWFWAWNFIGESSGVVVIAITIVSVGSGFYPMATNRTLYWRSSQLVIFLYGCMALANAIYYIQQKLIYHALSGQEVQALRDSIVDKGLYTAQQLAWQRALEQRQGLIPQGDAALTGVSSWRELSWAEQEMFARPVVWFYLGHQLLTLMTCIWVTFYLFVPLLKHHMKGPMGRTVDSDMMAVGVWYMSCLMTLAAAYMSLQIVYCVRHEFIFEQQAQALDLCIRITIAPIYFLPAPAFLIRFYREHFQKFRSGGRSGSGGNSGNRNNNTNFTNNVTFGGSFGGSGTNHQFGSGSGNSHNLGGSFTDSEVGQGRGGSTGSVLHNYLYGSKKTPRTGSRLGYRSDNDFPGRDSFEDEVEDEDLHLDRTPHPPNGQRLHSHHHHSLATSSSNTPISPTKASPNGAGTSAFKLFQTRDRGQSVESSRGLSRDFENESTQSHNYSEGGRSDHLLPGGGSCGHSNTNSVDLYNMQPLRRSSPLEGMHDIGLHLDGPKALPFEIMDSPQLPKAVLSSRYLRTPNDHANATRPDSEFMPRSPTRSENNLELESPVPLEEEEDPCQVVGNLNIPVATGTTGWEVGGFSAKISPPSTPSSPPKEQQPQQPQSQAEQKPSSFEPLANVRIEELTGLQRQLAEHRSALLPQVIAFREYHEDRATAEPFDHTFSRKPLTPDEKVSDTKDSGDYYRPSEEMVPVGGRGPPMGHPQHRREKENRRKEQQQQKSKEGGGLLSVFSKKKVSNGTLTNINNIGGGPTPGGATMTRDGSLESNDQSNQDSKEPTPVEELAAMSTFESEIHSRKGRLPYDYANPYDLGSRSSVGVAPSASDSGSGANNRAAPSISATSTLTRDSTSSNRPHSPPPKKASLSKFSTMTGSSGNLSTYSSSSASVAGSSNAKMLRSNIETAFRMSLDSTSPSPRSPSYTDLPRHSTSSFPWMDSPTTSVELVKTSLLPPPRQQQNSWRRSKNLKGAPVNVDGGTSFALSSAMSTSAPTVASARTGYHQDSGDEDDDDQEQRGSSYSAQNSPTGAGVSDTRSPSSQPLGPRYSQRSVDNLASAYYYRRASELNAGNSPSGTPIASSALVIPSPLPSPSLSSPTSATMQYNMYTPASTRIAAPSSLYSPSNPTPVLGNSGASTPPLSLQLKSSSSHGAGVNTVFPVSPRHKRSGEGNFSVVPVSSPSSSQSSSPSGRAMTSRNSPSPTQYLDGSHSTSTTMTMASAHLASTFYSTSVEGSNSGNRSNSFTHSQKPQITTAPYTSSLSTSSQQNRFMAEDPWTLAMMNRAQAQNLPSSSPSPVPSSSRKISYLQGQQQQQQQQQQQGQSQGFYGDEHRSYFSRPSMARTASE